MDPGVHDVLIGITADAVAAGVVPGGVVAVVSADGSVATVPFGVTDLATHRPVTYDTRFEIGSISKSCTALVVLGLVDQGLIGLDDAAVRHLPWLDVPSPFEPFTIRHLLQHTAGLVMGADAVPDERAQIAMMRGTVVGSPPGTFFHYSNLGYVVLGQIVQAVTGRSCADLVVERVLVPSGMTGSIARVTDADRETLATGYQPVFEDRPFLPGDRLAPATWFGVEAADGNVAAPGRDLGAYLAVLLARGRAGGSDVVSPQAFDEIVGSLAPDGEPSPNPSRYGLGLNVEQIAGSSCISHGGGMVGYASFIIGDLDERVGVAVMTNAPGDSPAAEWLARRVFGAVQSSAGIADVPDYRPWPDDEPDWQGGNWSDERGRFHVVREAGDPMLVDDEGSGRLVRLSADTWGCTHPGWRTFVHVVDHEGGSWTYGDRVLARGSAKASEPGALGVELAPVVGHYRSYSPWWTHLRIVGRAGRLHLLADNGVEANKDQPELVPVTPGVFRIGADPRLPERLALGPVVDGQVLWVDRDGCRYSRTFTP